MNIQHLRPLFFVFTFSLCVSLNSQVDSTCNYRFITQHLDSYYDSIFELGGDSSLKGTGYKEYFRWKNHMYFREGKNGDLNSHEDYLIDYFEGSRSISENDGSDWQYFGPKGVPETYSGMNQSPGSAGKGMMISLYIYPDHPDTILAGAHNSGLWKSSDGGETWHCLTDDNYKIRGVNSIVVDPDDPSVIIVSSFNSLSDNSYGIFKSNDGGNTWNEMNEGLEVNNTPIYPSLGYKKSHLPRKLIIRQSDRTLFLITHSYVFKADSLNNNWEMIFEYPYYHWLYDDGFFDIEFDINNDSIVYISGKDVFKSVDGNYSWDTITNLVIPDSIIHLRKRIEIATSKKYPGQIWFNYIYDHDTSGLTVNKTRIVKYDPQGSPQFYTYPYNGYTYAGAYAMEFELSPFSDSIFYLGAWVMYGYDVNADSIFMLSTTSHGPSDSNWVHVDVREVKIIEIDSLNYRMYLAHDGGVSWAICQGNSGSMWNWNFLPGNDEHGLDVFEFYDFTCVDDENDLVFGGCQDLAGFTFKDNNWYHFGKGDGGEVAIDDRNEDTTFIYYNTPGAFNGYIFRSTDFGQNLDPMFNHISGSLFTALSLHPFNEKELYYASTKLYHWPDARHVDDPNIITGINNSNPLSDIEIIHDGGAGPSVYKYISSQRYYGWPDTIPPADYNSCFWRGNTDYSSYVYGANYGYITDIETNPNDLNQIWAAFGKATKSTDSLKTKKIYVSNDRGGGTDTSWIPFVEGFPEGIPVRKLLYDHKYNRLYCASDVGVWVRDLNLENHEWVEFNNNLPFKIVTDLEIIYKQNKIRAATYGRGIWESPIFCNYNSVKYYVPEDSSITWTQDKLMTSDIVIPSGSELVISNCQVLMPTNAKIIVEKNARLSLIGAHITNACDDLWMGIEVWGDPSEAHDTAYQGFVKSTNGTIIENAYCALYAGKKDSLGYGIQGFGGGILQIINTTFRNNKRAVELWPYDDSDTTTFFERCTFETTEELLGGYNFEYFVIMNSYSTVGFYGCEFNNSRSAAELSAHYRGIGIRSIESQFLITLYDNQFPGGTDIRSTFNGLYYGVKSMNFTTLGGPHIFKSDFIHNVTGTYYSGISDAKVTECYYAVEALATQYNGYIYCGLYLDNCTGYHTEANYFYDSIFSSQFRPDAVIGITVNNSGGDANEIYRNYFDNLDIGILAQNSNRNNKNTDGLIIKCNDFGSTDGNIRNDIVVTTYDSCLNPGIFQYQGGYISANPPAGNLFSHYPPLNDFSDYNNQTLSGIYYRQHVTNPDRLNLEDYSELTMDREQTTIAYDSVNSCPSLITRSESEMRSSISENELKTDSVDLLLDILVDGGNTQALESDVIISTPPEAYSLHTNLMNKSPYLTDTVMIEVINKEDVLSPVMVKEILVANPQSAKSEEVMSELENRINPLPDYMISEIEAGQDTLGNKELMEADKYHFKHQRAINMNMLKSIYKFGTNGTVYSDSLVSLLEDENNVEAKYELIFEYIRRGEYSTASTLATNIPNLIVLSDKQLATHQKYDSLTPIIIDVYQNYKSVFELDSNQINILVGLVEDTNSIPGIYARNILIFTDNYNYTEPYILPDTSLKSEFIEKLPGSNSYDYPQFKLYPNPAGNYVNIEYNLEEKDCDSFVRITDNLGKTVKTITVSFKKNSVVVSTNDLNNGIYYVSLICNERNQITEKLIIHR
ncbi:MAG: T9SS type A sorting domain-containing protein [Bacteroidetes bacterium]|nr:T9SS type A sorting domain-containing protein [Bacteroidota bacterium]